MCERPKWKPRSSEMHRNSRPNVPTIYYRFFQGTGNNNFRYLQYHNIIWQSILETKRALISNYDNLGLFIIHPSLWLSRHTTNFGALQSRTNWSNIRGASFKYGTASSRPIWQLCYTARS